MKILGFFTTFSQAAMIATMSLSAVMAQSSGDAAGVNNGKPGIVLTLTTTTGASSLNFGSLASGATSSVQSLKACNTWDQPVEMVPNVSGIHPANFQLGNAGEAITLGAAGTTTACATLSVVAIAPSDLTGRVNSGEQKTFMFSGLASAGVKRPFSSDGKASLQLLPLQFSVTIDKTEEGEANS